MREKDRQRAKELLQKYLAEPMNFPRANIVVDMRTRLDLDAEIRDATARGVAHHTWINTLYGARCAVSPELAEDSYATENLFKDDRQRYLKEMAKDFDFDFKEPWHFDGYSGESDLGYSMHPDVEEPPC